MNHNKLDYHLDEPLALAGTATCDWQINPLKHDGSDDVSDWGHELVRKNEGGKSGISGNTNPGDLPRFDQNYDHVLERNAEIGGNTFRLSLDFARLCPQEGVFDEKLMEHYVRVLANCHKHGLEPMVTLHHWTQPKSFGEYDSDGNIKKGPLEHPRIVDHYAFYVNKVAEFLFDPQKIKKAVESEGYDKDFVDALCDDRQIAKWFISLNEPVNLLVTPYILGEFPPYQIASFLKYPKLLKKLKSMHDLSYETLHDSSITTQPRDEQEALKVGMAHNVMNSYMPIFESLANWGLVDKMEDDSQSDFMGIQYYFRIRLGLAGLMPVISGSDPRYRCDHDQFGQIHPVGLYDVLKYASDKYPSKELVVTEMGFADKSDRKRPDWILETVHHLIRARRDGVNVTGALLWSIINNFEWCKGMDAPFGIFDANGERLQSDDGSGISSREVWNQAGRHLLDPTPESADALSDLQLRTREQLNRTVQMVKVS